MTIVIDSPRTSTTSASVTKLHIHEIDFEDMTAWVSKEPLGELFPVQISLRSECRVDGRHRTCEDVVVYGVSGNLGIHAKLICDDELHSGFIHNNKSVAVASAA